MEPHTLFDIAHRVTCARLEVVESSSPEIMGAPAVCVNITNHEGVVH